MVQYTHASIDMVMLSFVRTIWRSRSMTFMRVSTSIRFYVMGLMYTRPGYAVRLYLLNRVMMPLNPWFTYWNGADQQQRRQPTHGTHVLKQPTQLPQAFRQHSQQASSYQLDPSIYSQALPFIRFGNIIMRSNRKLSSGFTGRTERRCLTVTAIFRPHPKPQPRNPFDCVQLITTVISELLKRSIKLIIIRQRQKVRSCCLQIAFSLLNFTFTSHPEPDSSCSAPRNDHQPLCTPVPSEPSFHVGECEARPCRQLSMIEKKKRVWEYKKKDSQVKGKEWGRDKGVSVMEGVVRLKENRRISDQDEGELEREYRNRPERMTEKPRDSREQYIKYREILKAGTYYFGYHGQKCPLSPNTNSFQRKKQIEPLMELNVYPIEEKSKMLQPQMEIIPGKPVPKFIPEPDFDTLVRNHLILKDQFDDAVRNSKKRSITDRIGLFQKRSSLFAPIAKIRQRVSPSFRKL